MPRPKRPRLVHTAPVLRGEKLSTTITAPPNIRNVSPASSGRVTNLTDDSDGLVTTQKLPAGTARPVVREEYTMTGALGDEEPSGTRLRPPSKRVVEEANRIAREANYAIIAAERRRVREIEDMKSSDKVQIQSSAEAGVGSRPESMVGSTAAQSRRPSILSRGQQTPLAHSSSLGAVLFKKRPRQPSLLQMVQSQNAQSELPDDDDEDLYDFRPDDESTPLVKSHNTIVALGSSSRQTSGSRKRKLATPEVQVLASQSDSILSSPSTALSQPPVLEDLAQPEDSVSTEPVLPQHSPAQPPASDTFSDTLAPPQSSSSPPPATSKRPTTNKASSKPAPLSKPKTRKQPNTTLPQTAQTKTTITTSSPARQPLKPLPTSALQNFLPRRRTRQRPPKGAFDFPSSSELEFDTSLLSEHEDELSFHTNSKLRRKPNPKTPARSMMQSIKKTTAKAAKGRTKETPIAINGKSNKRISKTYSRRSLAEADGDGVSEEDEDDSLGPASLKKHGKVMGRGELDGKAKKEMQRLARKFAEVDEFALEFEDMTGSSSQMADAR